MLLTHVLSAFNNITAQGNDEISLFECDTVFAIHTTKTLRTVV